MFPNNLWCAANAKATQLLVCLMLGLAASASIAYAQSTTEVLVTSDEQSPDSSGELSGFDNPATQRFNEVVFTADIRDGGFSVGSGIFRAGTGSLGGLEAVVYEGQPSPDGNGNFPSLSGVPSTNRSGEVGFGLSLESTLGGGADAPAVFTGYGGTEPLSLVARGQQAVPDTGGDVFAFLLEPIGYNNAGEVAFSSQALNGEEIGIWRGDGSPGGLDTVVFSEIDNPTGDGIMLGGLPQWGTDTNESGAVAFHDQTFLDEGGSELGIYRATSTGDLTKIARTEDPSPTGDGTYFSFLRFLPPFATGAVSINDLGEVAFVAVLENTNGGLTDNAALIRANGASAVPLVRKGELVPDGNGLFLELGAKHVVLNNRGEVLFHAALSGAANGETEGIFLADDQGIVQLARLNGPAPGGGIFEFFGDVMALNHAGQAVFHAIIDTGSISEDGLFFYDDGSLQKVVREGDALSGFGSVIGFSGGVPGNVSPERSLLNDYGQVAYRFSVSGLSGVALWTPAAILFIDGFESGDTSAWSAQL